MKKEKEKKRVNFRIGFPMLGKAKADKFRKREGISIYALNNPSLSLSFLHSHTHTQWKDKSIRLVFSPSSCSYYSHISM